MPPAELVERINRHGPINAPTPPRPLLSLEAFFTGNNDLGSIGYNLWDPPHPQEFYSMFRKVRERDDTADVLIEVLDQQEPGMWPATDMVWLITKAPVSEVESWFEESIAPDQILEGWDETKPREPYNVPDGFQVIGLWWD